MCRQISMQMCTIILFCWARIYNNVFARVQCNQWRSQKFLICEADFGGGDCSIRWIALLGYLDLSVPFIAVFCFLEMPELLLTPARSSVCFTNFKCFLHPTGPMLAEVSAYYSYQFFSEALASPTYMVATPQATLATISHFSVFCHLCLTTLCSCHLCL